MILLSRNINPVIKNDPLVEKTFITNQLLQIPNVLSKAVFVFLSGSGRKF